MRQYYLYAFLITKNIFMKLQSKCFLLLFAFVLFTGFVTMAQTSATSVVKNEPGMKTYLIERDIPGASKLDAAQLKGISQKSCSVLKELGPQIQWVHSYVAGDKIYCIYKAENEDLIRIHGKKGEFPITKITEIASVISPETAN
jgi:hypothetical protein